MFKKKDAAAKKAPGKALPPGRYRMGGEHFKDDAAFIATAVRDVNRLEEYCDLTADPIATVKLTDNVLWDSRARNDNGAIVFRTGGSGNWDWYGMIAAAARQ